MRNSTFLTTILIFILTAGCNKPIPESFIAVNRTGYNSDKTKLAFLVNNRADKFEILDSENSRVVFTGHPGIQKSADSSSGDRITYLDFSSFTKSGIYKIKATGTETGEIFSGSFRIGENVYKNALNTILNSFYYHRCGVGVANSTEWGHLICHLNDAPFYDNPDQTKTVTGGWHDAGDYNKFSVNTALSTGLLLYAFESYPESFKDSQLEIPEADNGIPDLLDEAGWALEWLLKMQRTDGAVYHKVSQKRWNGEFLPHEDPEIRYLFEPSSTATASFAAVTALGARHFSGLHPSFSDKLTEAALRAWNYLEVHPDNLPDGGFKNPSDVSGGEYGDSSDLDERLWASAELYRLTGQDIFLEYFIQNHTKSVQAKIPPISWRNVHVLSYRSFLFSDVKKEFSSVQKKVRSTVIRHANTILDVQKQNNYRNLNHHTEYYWGSNSVGLAYAFVLILAENITDDKNYKKAALDQLHYVLGRNPSDLSQVTGLGSASAKYPYHQLSELDHIPAPVPGMLVGGSNNYKLLDDKEISPYPAKNYEDTFTNYLVNEPAINYTAVLANVVSAFLNSKSLTEVATE